MRRFQLCQLSACCKLVCVEPSRFPFRALRRGLETVIEDVATAAPVAWFPVPLDYISTFPNGRAWVGTSANHLYIISLEGSSKRKGESGKPDGEDSPKSKV